MTLKDCGRGAGSAHPAGDGIAGLRYRAYSTGRRLTPAPPLGLADIRFRRAVTQLHALGPRVVAELLAEIAAAYLLRTPIEAMVERYIGRLDPATTRAIGADRFAPLPMRAIP
jgi:hypothetical protein